MTRLIPIVVAVLGGVAAVYAFGAVASTEKRTIEMTARQYAYSPERIHVNQGDEIRILIHSTDVVHGFFLEGYDIDETIVPQQPRTEIVFTADRRGKYRYRCSNTCGTLHPFMTGELIVGPNSALHAGLGGIIGLSVGLFVFFVIGRRKSADEDVGGGES